MNVEPVVKPCANAEPVAHNTAQMPHDGHLWQGVRSSDCYSLIGHETIETEDVTLYWCDGWPTA